MAMLNNQRVIIYIYIHRDVGHLRGFKENLQEIGNPYISMGKSRKSMVSSRFFS